MEIYEALAKLQFENRENAVYHPTYDTELSFYDLVKRGDVKALEEKLDWEQADKKERGILSKDPTRNARYHMIIAIAMITRFCIEGGLSEQEAYQLSDLYIKWLDETSDRKTLFEIQKKASFDFARRMQRIHKERDYSVHCKRALDYIYNHLHENIEIWQIADYVGLDETYMSKLFVKETGYTPGRFIRHQKVETAKNMLVYTKDSCAEIAQYLAFASSSHFTQVFKKETGYTPLQYRNQNYRKHW